MIVELLPILYTIVNATSFHNNRDLFAPSVWDYTHMKQAYDLFSDDSLFTYVWPTVPLDNLRYVPSDLVLLQSSQHLRLSDPNMKLRHEAALWLEKLAQDLYAQTGLPLSLISAYRSFNQQALINQRYWADTFRAIAWHSEHQLWLAVDILWLTNNSIQSNDHFRRIYLWMVANAFRYWFTQSYQKWVTVDWYEREDRHWRYVGRDLAQQLLDAGTTFTEYYEQQKFRP